MAIRQIRTMVAGIRIYLKAKMDANREMAQEDDGPGTLVVVQESEPNQTIGTLKIEIDRINANMNNLKADIIDTLKADIIESLRRDMEKWEQRIVMKLKEIRSS